MLHIKNLLRIQNIRYFCKQKELNQSSQQNKSEISPKDFSLIDIRIGQIIQCWKHPQSDNLYCEKIKVLRQPEKILQIGSGLQKYVTLQNMKGKAMIMTNLKTRKMLGFQSQGMVVCATSQDKSKCQIIVPDGQVGQRIFLQGYQDLFPQSNQLLGVLNPKKKILERALQHFKTNQQGYVVWKGVKLRTKKQYLKSNLKNALVY